MKKDLLNKKEIYYGSINMPKYFEINRYELKSDILISFIENKTISKDTLKYESLDYVVNHSKTHQVLINYIIEHLYLKYKLNLINVLSFGNVLDKNEQSFSRKIKNYKHKLDNLNYVMVYGVDVNDDCSIIFEDEDHSNNQELHHFNIKNNEFILFKSTERFFISKNISNKKNIFLITNLVEALY